MDFGQKRKNTCINPSSLHSYSESSQPKGSYKRPLQSPTITSQSTLNFQTICKDYGTGVIFLTLSNVIWPQIDMVEFKYFKVAQLSTTSNVKKPFKAVMSKPKSSLSPEWPERISDDEDYENEDFLHEKMFKAKRSSPEKKHSVTNLFKPKDQNRIYSNGDLDSYSNKEKNASNLNRLKPTPKNGDIDLYLGNIKPKQNKKENKSPNEEVT